MTQLNPPAEKIKTDARARKRSVSKKKTPKKITESYLHNSGLYYLQRFAASTAHFRKVMMRKIDKSCAHHKDQSREDCLRLLDELIAKFVDLGFLDDNAYCRGMVESLRRRGISRRAIHAKLAAKGLERDQIEQALQHYAKESEGDDELQAALRLARRRRIGPYRRTNQTDEREYQKALAAMARAGFSYDICQKILSMEKKDF